MSEQTIGDLAIDSLNSRFCYWQSSSGNRFLFSQIDAGELANFRDCVLLVATEQDDAMPVMRWVGQIDDMSPKVFQQFSAEDLANMRIYVHLLAGSTLERNHVVRDLAHFPDKSACRLSA